MRHKFCAFILLGACAFSAPAGAQEEPAAAPPVSETAPVIAPEPAMTAQPRVKLQTLDKATARTQTFEADVGSTMQFGPLFIKVETCQKSSPIARPESAAFIKIWETVPEKAGAQEKSEWVFSGWMFASSPALSPMDHPIYDVWLIECLPEIGQEPAPPPAPIVSEETQDDAVPVDTDAVPLD